MTFLVASFGRDGDLLIAVLFLALVAAGATLAWLLDGDRRLRHLIAVGRQAGPPPSVSASSGPDSASLPWPAAPPVGGSGPDVSPAGPDITRLVADVLLVARGFDPEHERSGPNGSGVVDRAEREAAAVVAALHDREVTV